MTTPAHLSDYLARIGLAGPAPVNAAGLAQIQLAHRQHIPFENLSIPLGEGVASTSDAVFAKLVTARRGGFCFEHNQLFADMLASLGFDVRLLLARVLLGKPEALPPRTHCLVLVRIDGVDWIADAGFGGAYAPPMRLAHCELAQSGDGAQHRLTRIGEEATLPGSWLLERLGPRETTDGRARSDSAWEAQYVFDLAEVAPADMALGCHWSATHESSRFTQVTVVSRCLPDGFVSLIDGKHSTWSAAGAKATRTIGTAEDYDTILRDQFGITLAQPRLAALFASLPTE